MPVTQGNAPSSLAPTDQAILRSYAAGLSSAEVAAEIDLSLNEVRLALRRMMQQFGAPSKLEA
jgi:DNA-binding CsgD family transcriptional regulator